MIKVQQLRKQVNKNSSNKAKAYSGKCSIRKMLKNGYGSTLEIIKPLIFHSNDIAYNIKINSSKSYISFIVDNSAKNVEFKNIKIYNAKHCAISFQNNVRKVLG